MTPEELAEALAAETERVEWKESDKDTGGILRAACALANDLGASGRIGYIVLGVRRDGQAVGIGVSGAAADDTIQAVVNKLHSTKTLPSPSVSVEEASHQGKPILVVRVRPQDVPPIVRVDGVAWVRVGTETRRASDADLSRFQERRPERNQPFDLRPVSGSAIDDLELRLLHESYVAARDIDNDTATFPTFESWLGQRDLLRRVTDAWRPTAAGLLLHGKSPQSVFPGAIVELARCSGTDFDSDVIERKTATGTLAAQLDAAWTWLNANVVEVPAPVEGPRTPYVPQYPIEALKELARNLVQHRLYEGTHAPGRISWLEDRVVFSNPGAPFGQASQGEFGSHSDYRNPTITRGLVDLGYVERLGRGVRRVRRLLDMNGNPPLEVETDGFTTVTVRRRA